MGTIIPPALFGIDPDEVWEYVPKAARELPKEEQPVFFLKSPDAAMDHRLEVEETKIHRATQKTFGKDRIAEMRKIEAIKPEDRTEDQKKLLETNSVEWLEAFVSAAENTDMFCLHADLLAACVDKWENFKTASGRAIAFPSTNRKKVADCLGAALRGELVEAIRKGIEITPEEKASLT